MPAPWSSSTIRRRARFGSTRVCTPSRYWAFRPRACAPYRARTKGKDERGVGYVKHNAIAGHRFASWAALEAHLQWWMREITDPRVHGTTGEPPLKRFRRDEAAALRPLDGRPPFRQIRELVRRVQADCCIELDTNSYSVPWRLMGESVQVAVAGGHVNIRHAGREVAAHVETDGRHQRVIEPSHFAGVVGGPRPVSLPIPAVPTELLRPLCEYEQLIGGGF
jgi:Mu transposase, C-terminal domain